MYAAAEIARVANEEALSMAMANLNNSVKLNHVNTYTYLIAVISGLFVLFVCVLVALVRRIKIERKHQLNDAHRSASRNGLNGWDNRYGPVA